MKYILLAISLIVSVTSVVNAQCTANCPEDIETKADEDLCSAIVTYNLPTGSDDCSGELTIEQTEGLGSGASFPVGITTESYTITDALGNTSSCSFTVTVVDLQSPEITCPDDIETKNDEGQCGAVVEYKLPEATDNCTIAKLEMTKGLGSGAMFPVGTTIETYTATDEAGNTSSCSISITVVDKELPIITLSKDKTSKWPPNHKHFEVKIEDYIKSVTDNCPGISIDDIIIDEVSSDEEMNGSGDGNTEDDIMISDDCKTVHLLAERSGNGNGRVYTINLAVEDAHGNIGISEIKAEISHDQGKKSKVVDDGPVYIVNGCDIYPVEIDQEEIIEEEIVEEEEVAIEEPVNEDDSENKMDKDNGSNAGSLETYPNPFKNTFTVNFKPQENDHIEINLYNLSGKKVKRLYKGDVVKDIYYSWDFNIENVRHRLFLLMIQGEKSYAAKRILHQ